MDLLLRLGIVAAILLGAAAFGWWWNRRQGQVVEAEGHSRFDAHQLAALDVDSTGLSAVAVLLGSPTCGPCETVKRVLGELSESRQDFDWVYADAADHLDVASAHHVLRVPTLFVLDAEGRILARTSGVPARQDLEHVLDRRGSSASV